MIKKYFKKEKVDCFYVFLVLVWILVFILFKFNVFEIL